MDEYDIEIEEIRQQHVVLVIRALRLIAPGSNTPCGAAARSGGHCLAQAGGSPASASTCRGSNERRSD
jgi:hypothetical protein